ncbi:DoxX family protein [Flagellimonas baculiformis]|uniref:DoxX family protein n=1 Tax=Flagellimonas baculiformis TaxID=3067310 RepID=UPI00296EAED8|nr:DoxX family protein [Muricauda sp. D6]
MSKVANVIYRTIFMGIKREAPISWALLIVRSVAGFGMFLHGTAKIGMPMTWMGDFIPGWLQLLVTMVEFGGGIAWVSGLATRLASLGISVTMLGAIIMGHLVVADPLYRITVTGNSEGPGVPFLEFPMWFATADGHSSFGSGSAELAILYFILGICLYYTGVDPSQSTGC